MKLRFGLGLTRHLISGVLCFAVISLICARASAQNLFVSVTDPSGNKIFEFTPDGEQSTFASGLSNPEGLAFDSAGNLFVGDGDAIYKFTPQGVRSTFALGLSSPYTIGCDNAGNLFVADGNSDILKLTPEAVRTTFASGVSGFGGVAVDGAGNLFVAYTVPNGNPATAYSFTIDKFTPDGARSTFASGPFPTSFGYVSGLGVDQAGNLYLVDAGQFYDGGSSTIYKFTPGGNRSTFFGPTTAWTQCFFGSLAVDSMGNVFVTDDCAGILKITPSGVRTTFVSGWVGGLLAFQPTLTPGLGQLQNISTRLRVETGDNVPIGGFIITGSQAKKVMVRAIGPSLPLADVLANPTLELHDSAGTLITSNDNWMDAPNRQEIIDSTIAPTNDLESTILVSLDPGLYTAIVRGVNDTIGVGLVEVYDLDNTVDSKLANISTRGLVQTGDDVMIGGIIILGPDPQEVLLRAIGPSLLVAGALADPTLELHDKDGAMIASNDDWRSDQEADIVATTLPPTDDAESAILMTLTPDAYTAIVSGVNGTTGVGLVEIFNLH